MPSTALPTARVMKSCVSLPRPFSWSGPVVPLPVLTLAPGGVAVGEAEPVAHHVLDAVLEDDQPFLEGVVGQGHVVGHHYLERQPKHHVVAVLAGVPERHLKVPVIGYRASIHLSVSLVVISRLSSR